MRQYRANAHRAYANACKRRAEMERMIADRRAEATRLAREKAAKADAERRTALLRMSPTKDKMWNLYRANAMDGPNGSLIGKYQNRGDATKVVAQVAYQPDQL